MRRRIAIMFVELEHLRMSSFFFFSLLFWKKRTRTNASKLAKRTGEEELTKRMVHDGKLDALNEAFVVMTRITHTFEGGFSEAIVLLRWTRLGWH